MKEDRGTLVCARGRRPQVVWPSSELRSSDVHGKPAATYGNDQLYDDFTLTTGAKTPRNRVDGVLPRSRISREQSDRSDDTLLDPDETAASIISLAREAMPPAKSKIVALG